MKTPQLKGFDCFDHDPIAEWSPESESDVFFSLCLHIGPPDEAGADLFYVDVMTPQAGNESTRGTRVSERRIVVSPYSWEAVLESVRAILASCTGETWSEQSASLAKHFNWEFENYRPSIN
jgi:hypothetical protein